MTAILLAGVVFMVLAAGGVLERLIRVIPTSLKMGIAAAAILLP